MLIVFDIFMIKIRPLIKKLFRTEDKTVSKEVHNNIIKNTANNIIKNTAKKILSPHGLRQKGYSRTFIYDNNWWIVIVEFQPSGWGRGTYLNVGCMWLLDERDHFAYNYGYRRADFVEFENENQFTQECIRLANIALNKVNEAKKTFPNIKQIYKHVIKDIDDNDIWGTYYAAVLSGLMGDKKTALKWFNIIESYKAQRDWEIAVKKVSKKLESKLSNPKLFRNSIINIVKTTRKLLKLERRKIILE